MRVLTSVRTNSVCIIALASALLGADQAAAQQPCQDQIAAIKSNCSSDYLSYCSSVPRGGSQALQCLKSNLAKLSSGCQQAVKAAAATAAAPLNAGTPAPSKPVAEAKSAVPAPPASATTQPAPSAPASSATTQPATPAPSTTASSAPASPAADATAKSGSPAKSAKKTASTTAKAAAPSAVAPALGFIPPRKKLMLARSCRDDFRVYCPGVDVGCRSSHHLPEREYQ